MSGAENLHPRVEMENHVPDDLVQRNDILWTFYMFLAMTWTTEMWEWQMLMQFCIIFLKLQSFEHNAVAMSLWSQTLVTCNLVTWACTWFVSLWLISLQYLAFQYMYLLLQFSSYLWFCTIWGCTSSYDTEQWWERYNTPHFLHTRVTSVSWGRMLKHFWFTFWFSGLKSIIMVNYVVIG